MKPLLDIQTEDRFRLDDTFVQDYSKKKPDFGGNGLGLIVYKRCVDESTLVLCDDLVWRRAGDLSEGDGIIGFDSEPKRVIKTDKRYIRTGKVLYNAVEDAECVGIELEDEQILYATPDHKWLVKFANNPLVSWRESKDLASTQRGNSIYLLRPYGEPWTEDDSYDAGFLSAAYDGEGNLDRLNGIQFTQVQNGMLERVEGILGDRDIGYDKRIKNSKTSYGYKHNRQICYSIRTHGIKNVFRFLGIMRPPRLLDKFHENLIKRTSEDRGTELRCSPNDYVKVIRVFDAGIRKVAVLSTDIETHITGGFASHNTYARPLEDGTTEDWWQTVKRVVEGVYSVQKWHCHKLNLPWSDRKAQRSAKEMYRLIFEMKFLPPGRGLWAMGTPYLEKNGSTPLYNCAFISTEDINKGFAAPFAFLMDFSMLGVGVGFDTLGAGTITIRKPKINDISKPHVVEDSRQGWVSLVERTINAYSGVGTIPNEVDYDQIRPAGAPLRGFGGIAAGPDPLKTCVERIREILDPLIGKRITSTAIVDLMNVIGVCVVSGNIRRSAELALGYSGDKDFLILKDPERFSKELLTHRWASNNTVVVSVGDDYKDASILTAKNGEPGYFWIDNARKYGRMVDAPDNKDYKVQGLNPCAEITLESGEVCNLVETFPSRHDSYEEYERTLKMAYLYSKTVTLIPTHNRLTNKVQSRNRRIGLSQSGIVQSMQKIGRREHLRWCDTGYKYLQKLDKQYSDWLGIPRSIKMTTVKPSGTVSQLPGVTPGIHFEHSEYYFRTVRISKTSALLPKLEKAGYRIEDDLYDPSSTVVYFPIHAKSFDREKSQVSMWEQLKLASEMQKYWADNAVSITVTFNLGESEEIGHALELFESDLKSVSFLPMENHGYAQAPYQTIDKNIYDEAYKKLKPINLKIDTHEMVDAYCEGDKCEVPWMKTPQ